MNNPSSQEANSSIDEDPLPEPDPFSPHSIYQHLERQAATSSFEVAVPGDPLVVTTECRMMPPQLFSLLEDHTSLLRGLADEQLAWFDDLDIPRTFIDFRSNETYYVLDISDVTDRYLRASFDGDTVSIQTGRLHSNQEDVVHSVKKVALTEADRQAMALEFEAIGIEILTLAQPAVTKQRKPAAVVTAPEVPVMVRRRFGGGLLRKFVSL